jgi:hypothetical protein
MITHERDGSLLLFDQRDHSALCGDMARAWGAPPFQAVPEWVQRAAEIHDNGWPEWDGRPRIEADTGRPHNYSRMPDEDYRAIWERGLARGWAEGEGTGLIVSLHAMRFFARKERPEDRALLRRERERQVEALRRLGSPDGDPEALPEPFATWHAWMFFWDGLSLFLCERWTSPWRSRLPSMNGEVEIEVTRVVEEADRGAVGSLVVVEPFPFAAPLELGVHARAIPAARYPDQCALDAAVQDAASLPFRFRVRGGGG